MSVDFAADLAEFLEDEGEGTVGADIFIGLERPADGIVPALCTFISVYGGPPPEPIMGTAKHNIYRPRAQLLVRGAKDGEAAAESRCRSHMEKLQRAQPTGYLGVTLLQSAPFPLGQNKAEQPRYVFNVEGTVQQV